MFPFDDVIMIKVFMVTHGVTSSQHVYKSRADDIAVCYRLIIA